ncbi:uracil-DNA glycosylase [Salegentibacter sp. HM20]
MKLEITQDWKKELQPEFEKEYFKNLWDFIAEEYQEYQCYPASESLFAAFNFSRFQETKVVILGQDPYHGPGQAHGLSFSVNDGVNFPPSLKNIFRELEQDTGKSIPFSGNLESWARQGVLLLNASLSVRQGQAGSHQKQGWEKFTDRVIEILSEKRENLVFLLWGSFAQKKEKLIDTNRHLVLKTGHPSPLSANRGYWFGNKHFSQTNEFLQKNGKEPIDW